MDNHTTRAGFAAIIGAPNAGKSTLVNALVGEKVSIVTHKVQTTRFQVRGIALHEETQIVLVDTPGIFEPKKRLDRSMVEAAWSGAGEADLVVHVIDAGSAIRLLKGGDAIRAQDKKAREDVKRIQKALKNRKPEQTWVVLNKIDEYSRDELLPLIAEISETGLYGNTFLISALQGDGVKDLKAAMAKAMPEGPWLYPEDQVADIPSRLLAAEITREKLFLRLHDELPYHLSVETEQWKQQKNGLIRISQTIYVTRDAHKPIVLGKGGATIKSVGVDARKELQNWLGAKVHLELFVKVRKNWTDDPARYAELGLNFDV